MNILVTGAGGQLGKALRKISDLSGHRCFFTDIRPEGEVVALDITDGEAVGRMLDAEDIDVVVNCAAYTDVERAETDVCLLDVSNLSSRGSVGHYVLKV